MTTSDQLWWETRAKVTSRREVVMTGCFALREMPRIAWLGFVLAVFAILPAQAEACPPIEVIDTEPNTPVEWQWGDPTVLTVTVPERGEVRDSRATHPVVGQTYSASDDTRQDARAWSTLSVSRFGGAILAEMRQRVSLLDANSPAAGATGVAYLHIRAERDPNDPNVAWMRVWKHQTITATPGIGGTYSIDGGAATTLPDEAVRLTSYRDIEVGGGLRVGTDG